MKASRLLSYLREQEDNSRIDNYKNVIGEFPYSDYESKFYPQHTPE